MKNLPELNEDGSVKCEPFHFSIKRNNYDGGYPHPKRESYEEYRNRVDRDFIAKGFDLGDLSNSDWSNYCMGSGSYEGVDSSDIIE